MKALLLLLFAFNDLALKSQQAKRDMEAGRFAQAAAIYQEIARALPNNPGIVMNLGLALHSAGKYQEASQQFQAVLKMQPDFVPALVLLGIDYLKLGAAPKAIEPLTRAIRADPKNKIALLELADAHLSLGRAQEAATYFTRLSELDPMHSKALQGLGLAYLALARQEFEKLPEESPYWYALLARSKAEQGQYRTAFHLYREALEREPSLPGAHEAIAQIYRATGHPDWAAAEARKATNAAVPPPRAEGPALRYQRAKEFSDLALSTFERLSRLPPSAEMHELLADSYSVQSSYKSAAEELRKALTLAPADRRLEQKLATALWRNRDYEQALVTLEGLARSEPPAPEVLHQLGDTLLNLQRPNEAIPYLLACLRVNPGLLEAHASLGRAYMRSGTPEKAVVHLQKALPNDEDGSIHFQLARAYDRTGRSAEAAKAMESFERLSKADQARKQKTDSERQITPP
jgi:tetratricopeptide (TPR) repeat protein